VEEEYDFDTEKDIQPDKNLDQNGYYTMLVGSSDALVENISR